MYLLPRCDENTKPGEVISVETIAESLAYCNKGMIRSSHGSAIKLKDSQPHWSLVMCV